MRSSLVISAVLAVLALVLAVAFFDAAGCRKTGDDKKSSEPAPEPEEAYSPLPVLPEPTPEQLTAAVEEYGKQLGYHQDKTPSLDSLRSDFCRRAGQPQLPCFFANGGNESRLKGLPSLPFGFGLELIGRVTDDGLKNLAKLNNLTVLCLRNYGGTGAGLKDLANLTVLDVYAYNGNTPETDFRELLELKHLTAIKLSASNPHLLRYREFLSEIGRLKNLKTLELDLPLTDEELKGLAQQLAKIKDLTALSLTLKFGGPNNDVGFKELAQLKKLTALTVDRMSVTDAGLRHLAPLRTLNLLNLRGQNRRESFTDELLHVLREIDLLHALTLASTGGPNRPTNAKEVFSFDLTDTSVTVAGVKELAPFENLNALNLTGIGWMSGILGESDESRELRRRGSWKELASLLASFQKLETLNLTQTWVTNSELKDLAALKTLTSLNLARTRVTRDGLKELTPLQNLTSLNLNDLPVMDVGLKDLAPLKRLATLYLHNTGVTEAGAAEFRKLLPGCKLILY